jgi:hypothetical protein
VLDLEVEEEEEEEEEEEVSVFSGADERLTSVTFVVTLIAEGKKIEKNEIEK